MTFPDIVLQLNLRARTAHRAPLRVVPAFTRAGLLRPRATAAPDFARSTRTVTEPGLSKMETSSDTCPRMTMPGCGTRPAR